MKEKNVFVSMMAMAFFLIILLTGNSMAQEITPADTVVQPQVTPAPAPQPTEVTPAPAPQPTEPVIEEVVPEEEVVEEEVPQEEVVKEEPSKYVPGWKYKAYVNVGFIEPFGDPGTGQIFGWHPSGDNHGTGLRFAGGAQINPQTFFKLPVVLQPLSVEALVGYSFFTSYSDNEEKTSIISLSLCGRYDLTDLVLKAIGIEYPALGLFGVAGLQVNMQSWDMPNSHPAGIDSKVAFGTNFAVGVKYNLMSAIGKPVEIDLRGTWNPFIMGDVKDKNDVPIVSGGSYKHYEAGFVLGIAYPF